MTSALIVANCETGAYAEILQTLRPEWTVKAARTDVAERMRLEARRDFLDYCRHADVVVGAVRHAAIGDLLGARAELVEIPAFEFTGLHPDSFHLRRSTHSPLGAGNLHSRIVSILYLKGKDAGQARQGFCEESYQALGYLNAFDVAAAALVRRFGAFGIDLSGKIDRWLSGDPFLYTLNHPKPIVFQDILVEALRCRVPHLDDQAIERAYRTPPRDYLAGSIRWPVYPEIARAHGFHAQPFEWRTPKSLGRKRLDLAQFVAQSYRCFDRIAGLVPGDIPGFEEGARVLAQ